MMKKLKILLILAVIMSAMACVTANPVVITRSINLVDVWNSPGVWANDFHIVFKANDLSGNLIEESYLDSVGYYCSIAGATRAVWTDAQGFIHVEWTFPDICVDPSQPVSFGFTMLGGMQYEAVDWYWTYNGDRIQGYDDVWQDWIRVGNELQDIIINREQYPVTIQRTTGIEPAPLTIVDVANLPSPPNPVPPEILPIPAPPGVGIIYPWPWPVEDPTYFMYYDLYDASGSLSAVFRNAAVLQEIPDTSEVKWEQLPDETETGIDIRCDRNDQIPRRLADDFECTKTGPITDIHFWGSWFGDVKGDIDKIHVTIYGDIPAEESQTGYSMPDDNILWEMTVTSSDFVETLHKDIAPRWEGWWDPFSWGMPPYITMGDQKIWKYDIYIDEEDAFIQEGSETEPKVYWLEIWVELTANSMESQFGWKTSLDHWNDDAVFSGDGWMELIYPQEHPYHPNSIDLAFMLTTGDFNEPNEPKWEQLPDLSEFGIDIDASDPYILADDFNCNKTELITKITVWGSWLNDVLPLGDASNVRFTLSIHEDIPDPDPEDPMSYSMPGETKWLYIAEPGTFSVEIERDQILEGWWSPMDPMGYIFPGDTVCWKYTFDIPTSMAFCQSGTAEMPKVYWLDVQAKPLDEMGEARFGWKTSIDHWNDSAVWGMGMEPYMGPWNELLYPMEHELWNQPIDLAFAIEGDEPCPEPMADLGDAPDSTNSFYTIPMTAYPGPGIMANFPTVYNIGSPPHGPMHRQPAAAFHLGRGVSLEKEADIGCDQDGINNLYVLMDSANQDGSDDSMPQMPYLPRCRVVKFDYIVKVIDANRPIFANVWFDWNRDGDWDDISICDSNKPADEWAVQDQTLAFTAPGMYVVSTPPFRTYDNIDQSDIANIWMRITLSETPYQPSGSGGSGPVGGYMFGETEDFFFSPDTSCWSCGDFDLNGVIDEYDLKELTDNWLWISTGDHREADLDCDGDIEFIDYAILADQWLNSCP